MVRACCLERAFPKLTLNLKRGLRIREKIKGEGVGGYSCDGPFEHLSG